MLAQAAVSIGLEVNRPPSPKPSRLDDLFLGAGTAHNRVLLLEHEELTKSWMAPFMAKSRSSVSSVPTTLDAVSARGYAGIPQVERAVVVHLCSQNAATWRNRPCLPPKACKLSDVLHGGPGEPSLAQPGRDEGWSRSPKSPEVSYINRLGGI